MPRRVRGWIFDVYPSDVGEMAIWIISENGERVRLTDKFQPKVYVSSKYENVERLISKIYSNLDIASWSFVYKYANPTDSEKSKVLEITLKDCRRVSAFTNEILKLGDYLRYQVHNCDLHGDRAYYFSHDLFPLAFLEVETQKTDLKYTLLDSVERINYSIPPLRIMQIDVVDKKGKIGDLTTP